MKKALGRHITTPERQLKEYYNPFLTQRIRNERVDFLYKRSNEVICHCIQTSRHVAKISSNNLPL